MFGIINLFKPIGPTSRDCVNHLQRLVRPTKVGHAGTLDPMADGVLLVPVGQAVRLVDWLHELPKTYEAVFELGLTSLSGDNQMETTRLDQAPTLGRRDWERTIPEFLGDIQQVPPIFSAVKVDGRRAYDLARKGHEIELEARTVSIHRLEIDAFEYPYVSMTIECSTGTYIRSLGRDMARRLGSDAVMTKLTRTSIGGFRSDQAIGLDELQSIEDVEACLMNPTIGLKHMPQVQLSDIQLRDLIHGKSIALETSGDDLLHAKDLLGLDATGRLRSIMRRRDDGSWIPHRNFLEGLL